jgi:hypothetical protein
MDEKMKGLDVKKRWEPLEKQYAGRIAELVRHGGGKMSTTGGDPGESRKETPDP